MKKTFLAVLAIGVAVDMAAQNTYDAVTLSDNNYYGTAKSMALGGAMTAVGGDLGSIGTNPAGSAVASYSQFSFSPCFSNAGVKASYSPGSDEGYGASCKSSRSRLSLPDIGFTTYLPTGNRTGLKSVTFGVLLNTTNVYLENVNGSGSNPYTSLSGAYGVAAQGQDPDVLGDYSTYYSSVPWKPIMAYQSGMISYLAGSNDYYKGASEVAYEEEDGSYTIMQGGPVTQSYRRSLVGSKYDLLLNAGLNFSDKLYVGVNFGMPMISYTMKEYIDEAAVDPSSFSQIIDGTTMQYESSSYQSYYSVSGVGIYGKVGVIWRPVGGLRLGAAVQTPTYYEITERYQISGTCDYDKSSGSASSPEDDYGYVLTSPAIVNLGVAYAFAFNSGRALLLSADYEMDCYNTMKFTSLDDEYGYYDYSIINSANARFTGVQHYFRAGVEYKLNQAFSLRAGCSLKTSPLKYGYDTYGNKVDAEAYLNNAEYYNGLVSFSDMKYAPDVTRTYSLGCGYSSRGSFYCDAAMRLTSYPKSVNFLYDDYSYNEDGTWCAAASMLERKTMMDVVLTLGWRF